MKHAFKFPLHIRESVRRHVEQAVALVDPQRFGQEPKYVSSLITHLDGIVYEKSDGYVRFISTDIDDRGPDSAEKRYGADFAIVAEISDRIVTVRKAILFQAKLGIISELATNEVSKLDSQIRRMKRIVNAPKVMEIPITDGHRQARIISGNRIIEKKPYSSVLLSDYFVARVTTTLDGETEPHLVEAVGQSNLRKLDVIARYFS